MMVRFFAHGDGSGRAAVEYLLASEVPAYTEDRKRIPGKTVRREVAPEVLSGDPDLTCHLIDSNTRKWRYTSGVLAFHAEDGPSEAQQGDIMRDFEKAAFAGLKEDQASKIRNATAALEESRKEWRTVTWKTMLPSYLAGVCLTSWVLLMAVQLTFPEQPSRIETPGLATFGLEGTRVTRGLGGLGQVINLPPGVTLANCPVPNLGGGEVCVETVRTR